MIIHQGARKTVEWTLFGLPDDHGVVMAEVSFDGGATWSTQPVAGNEVSILVAGPHAVDNPAGTIVLPVGSYTGQVRVALGDELHLLAGGVLTISSTLYSNTEWSFVWPSDHDAVIAATTEQMDTAEQFAISVLRMLTLGRVGGVPRKIEPCGDGCALPMGYYWPGIGPGFVPYFDGTMRNCWCGFGCGCISQPSVTIPGPVGRIDQVLVDGEVLDPSSYHVVNGDTLVRTDGQRWPQCAQSGFEITYVQGYLVDEMGKYAARVLALEYLGAMTGEGKCRLPTSVRTLARSGVTMELSTGMFPDGLTGIREVDSFIRLWNPDGRSSLPEVLSPDTDPHYREVSHRG